MKLLSNNIGSESILDSIKKLIGIEDTETYSIKEIPYYSRQFQPYKAIKIKHFQIENGKLILDDKE